MLLYTHINTCVPNAKPCGSRAQNLENLPGTSANSRGSTVDSPESGPFFCPNGCQPELTGFADRLRDHQVSIYQSNMLSWLVPRCDFFNASI